MENYVVSKSFLEDLGFKEFDKIEGKRTASWWDYEFVLEITKQHFIDQLGDIKDLEIEINTIAFTSLLEMRKYDYSKINNYLKDKIVDSSAPVIYGEYEYNKSINKVTLKNNNQTESNINNEEKYKKFNSAFEEEEEFLY